MSDKCKGDCRDCQCDNLIPRSNICAYCETDPAESNSILCKDCLKGNEVNLFINCRKCGSHSRFFNLNYNLYDIICTRIRSGKTKPGDLVMTGSGFLIYADECPNCEKDRLKREAVDTKVKSFWE